MQERREQKYVCQGWRDWLHLKSSKPKRTSVSKSCNVLNCYHSWSLRAKSENWTKMAPHEALLVLKTSIKGFVCGTPKKFHFFLNSTWNKRIALLADLKMKALRAFMNLRQCLRELGSSENTRHLLRGKNPWRKCNRGGFCQKGVDPTNSSLFTSRHKHFFPPLVHRIFSCWKHVKNSSLITKFVCWQESKMWVELKSWSFPNTKLRKTEEPNFPQLHVNLTWLNTSSISSRIAPLLRIKHFLSFNWYHRFSRAFTCNSTFVKDCIKPG